MKTVLLETIEDGIALVTLNRPERLNAITLEWMDDFHQVIDQLDANRAYRVAIVTGAGRGFCAGYDLKSDSSVLHDAGGGPAYEGMRGQERLSGIIKRLRELPQPVIAAVNGPAAGAGFAVALAADIRFGSETANFHVANARIGLSAGECGISWLLPRLIGLSRSFELMLTGRPCDAQEALQIGLISKMVQNEQLMPTALETARLIAANAPFGVWMTKDVVLSNLESPSFDAALHLENRMQVLCAMTGDVDIAMQAFREKRTPKFRQPL